MLLIFLSLIFNFLVYLMLGSLIYNKTLDLTDFSFNVFCKVTSNLSKVKSTKFLPESGRRRKDLNEGKEPQICT